MPMLDFNRQVDNETAKTILDLLCEKCDFKRQGCTHNFISLAISSSGEVMTVSAGCKVNITVTEPEQKTE